MARYKRLKETFLKEALGGAKVTPDELVWSDDAMDSLIDDYLAATDEEDRMVAQHTISSLLYISANRAHRVGDSKIGWLIGQIATSEQADEAKKRRSQQNRKFKP